MPDTHAQVKGKLARGFKALQQSGHFGNEGINLLYAALLNDDIGKKVIGEHPTVFAAGADRVRNLAFRKAGQMSTSDIVTQLDGDGLDEEEKRDLTVALAQHNDKMQELQGRYLTLSSVEQMKAQVKQDLNLVLPRGSAPTSNETARNYLTHLAAAYMVVRSGEAYLAASIQDKKEVLVTPHSGQMVTLFRLLRVHDSGSWYSPILHFFTRVRTSMAGTVPPICENHLAQILTGEGKCLTLGLLAAFCALSGMDVDVVCYQHYLVEQDWKAMEPFYEFLRITDKIHYATFQDICENRLSCIQDASKELLSRSNTSREPNHISPEKRVLLVSCSSFI